jgi:hypothetical protein
MNIAKELEATQQFEAEYNGHKITFDAATASLTPAFIMNIGEVTDYPKAVAAVVKDWDVTKDDEGNKWPLDEESLGKLPVKFLSTIIDRIGESWAGEKKSGSPSVSGSAQAAK